jgi:hypothetical protein
MCQGSKKCKQCNSIKIGTTMARKKKATSRRRRISGTAAKFSTNDLAMGILGGIGSLAANRLINQVVAKQPEKTREILSKAIPAAKVALGGYLATQRKMKRNLRFVGVGVAASGAIELAAAVAPQFIGIQGTGDLYQQIGSADPLLRLTVDPAVAGEYSSRPAMYGEEMMAEESLVIQ